MNDLLKTVKSLIHLRKVDDALALEAYLYDKHVKPVEAEDHYFDKFQLWAKMYEEAGERDAQKPSTGETVGFVVHSDSPMAHVKALLNLCELRPNGRKAAVFVLSQDGGQLRTLFSLYDVRVYYLARGGDQLTTQIERMRQILVEAKIGTLVWVSLPLWCSYAFARRLATKQVFWSQRFHPLISKHIDIYICPGKRTETTRNYHGQEWQVAHTPLCLEVGGVGGAVKTSRPFKPTYGTIGREEKIQVPEFMDAVVSIHKGAGGGFLWTGRKELHAIQTALRGVPNSFQGWVEPSDYIRGLDLYLETFPLGGLCTQTAWELGVPVVALDNPHSTYGSVEYEGLLSAKDTAQYVDMAISVLTDPLAARVAAEAGREALAQEHQQARGDVEKWWSLVD